MTDQTNPVNWFEIPVNDLERARQFYETVFGFQLSLNEMGPMRMAWFPMTQGEGGATLMPKTGIGEHGYIAHFQDCEGNRVALHSMT